MLEYERKHWKYNLYIKSLNEDFSLTAGGSFGYQRNDYIIFLSLIPDFPVPIY